MNVKDFLEEKRKLDAMQEALAATLRRQFWVDEACVLKVTDIRLEPPAGFGLQAFNRTGLRMDLNSLPSDRMRAYARVHAAMSGWLDGEVGDMPTPRSVGLYESLDDLLDRGSALKDTPPPQFKIRNLTPHEVVVELPDGPPRIFPSDSVRPARLVFNDMPAGNVDGIPCVDMVITGVQDLPDPVPGVVLIVSAFVLQQFPERTDLVSPDTRNGSASKDFTGRVTTVRQFRRT